MYTDQIEWSRELEEGLQRWRGDGTLGTAYRPGVSLEGRPAPRLHVRRTVATAAKFGIDPDQAEGSTGVKGIQQNHRQGSGLRAIFFILYLN